MPQQQGATRTMLCKVVAGEAPAIRAVLDLHDIPPRCRIAAHEPSARRDRGVLASHQQTTEALSAALAGGRIATSSSEERQDFCPHRPPDFVILVTD